LVGTLVADPEAVNDGNILKFRIAVDYAGSEKGGSTSGFFDVVYYANSPEQNRNAEWVKSQISAGNLKKGSSIQLVGRLVQERWKADDRNASKVVLVAETLTYYGFKRDSESSGGKSASAGAGSSANLPDSF
jgi:single-stranded DNA-binding protein